jgi:hypothetical protein
MNLAESNTRTERAPQDESHELRSRRRRVDLKIAARWHRQIIAFLIRLSQSDTGALFSAERPGDLLNLAHDLLHFRFVLANGDAPTRETADSLAQWLRSRPDRFLRSIESLRKLLDAVAGRGQFQWELAKGTKVTLDAKALKAGDVVRRFTFSSAGAFEQAMILGAMLALASEEGPMVRRCARESCQRIFLAGRPKQIFCGRPCASAAAFERYKHERGEEAFRTEHRKTARASWRLKQRRLGRTVKPRIRDRRGADQP